MHVRSLAVGLLAVAMAGCTNDSPSAPPPANDRAGVGAAAAAPQTSSARWMLLTRAIVGRREPGPLGATRAFTLVSVAQYDAVIAAEQARGGPYRPSPSAAASAAAAGVLAALYPMEQAPIDGQLASDAADAKTPGRSRAMDYMSGLAIGRRVAAAVIAHAATDGSSLVWTGTAPSGPGFWMSAPAPAQPLGPRWGEVRPWRMSSGSQFRPAPPPAYGTPAFLTALQEVRAITDGRTPSELVIAQFWQGGSGPGGPMGHFAAVAGRLAAEHRLDERATTRVLAVMHMAMMDASIGCWDAKYAYWYIRPHQADPAITTPVGRPNFPAYPSAHSCFSAAAAGVLASYFPAATRDLEAQVAEAGVARLYAGLHFRFDIDAGNKLGAAVARQAIDQAPRGHTAIGKM